MQKITLKTRQAHERYAFAKLRMTHAAQAALDGLPDAARLASEALVELDGARAALAALTEGQA